MLFICPQMRARVVNKSRATNVTLLLGSALNRDQLNVRASRARY